MNTKLIFASVAAMAALTGCSNSDDPVVDSSATPVNFTASINSASRAFDQTWEANDKIGISGTTGGKQYTNVAYTTATGSGGFAVVTSGSEIYYQSPDEVTFTAYYPWNDLSGQTLITADTRRQADQKTFDFLWAQAVGSKANPDVEFAFSHRMTKLVLTVKCGADVSYDEVKASVLTLAGFIHDGTFDVASGVTATTGESCQEWSFANSATKDNNAPSVPNDTEQTVTYTLILLPQAFSAPLPLTAATSLQTFSTMLDFTEANSSAADADAGNEWKAGRQYNMSVTLHKTALTIDGYDIAEWVEADGGNFDAE